MFDALTWLIERLIPPIDADPEHQYRWRLTMAVLMVITPVTLGLHIALACGYLKPFYPGFASAAAVDQANATLSTVLSNQDETKIITARTNQCKAEKGTDPNRQLLLDTAREELRKATVDWQKDAGSSTPYPIPGCEELGI